MVNPIKYCIVFALMSAGLYAQTVAGSFAGTVIDTTKGIITDAEVKLIDQGTRTSRVVTTDKLGEFRFSNIPPSVYCLAITKEGFKTWAVIDTNLSAGETRDMGRITLEVGSVSEQMAVDANATPVETKSSENSSLVDSEQLNRIALKGRDLFGFVSLIPGVIDTANRDVTSPNGLGNITINGNTSAKNFTVDGITDVDTGSNTTIHYEPNMDAIQEVKVLTSNYQAEFGRNSGGQITVITKSGARDWHGTGSWNHRHEEFNANDYFNNRSGLSRTPYRFNVAGWSLGGPAYIPLGLLKHTKNKLFFFASQEYTNQLVNQATQYRSVPTVLERAGNFSQSFSGSGALLKITDPQNGNVQFAGNVIPASRFSAMGLDILNYVPVPNNPYGPPAAGSSSLANSYNFQDSGSASHPRRNDVIRFDFNPTQKIFGYVRYIADADNQTVLYQGIEWKAGDVSHPNPGKGYAGTLSYVISPSMVNDFTVGRSSNAWDYLQLDPAAVDRSLVGNIPFLFTKTLTSISDPNGMHNFVPSISFGSAPANPVTIGTGTAEYTNANTIYTAQDNISKILGPHSFKAGVYLEKNYKTQPAGNNYAGTLSFAPDANNPLNSGDGYANALLGNFDTYSEASLRTVFNVAYWNAEFYLQDNWRVSRKLTLDLGVRFYHQTPQVDLNKTFAYFNAAAYVQSAAARMFVPALSAGKRVAEDPVSGLVEPASYIGLFVPNSGNTAEGMVVPGVNGAPAAAYSTSPIAVAPRVGFAYDVFGNGKTALRGGYGYFYNRLDGNQVYSMSGQAPVAYTPTVYYQSLASLASTGGVFGPGTVNTFDGNVPFDHVRNGSLDLQQALPGGMVLDASYVGNWASNLNLRVNINPVALGADFLPANADPTQSGKPLPANLLRTDYPGYAAINQLEFLGSSNYNALQVKLQRRFSKGLTYGASYTWSHSLGVTSFDPLVASNEERNYGPTAADRRQAVVLFYSYDIPDPAKRLHVKAVDAVVSHWTVSGITTMATGLPYTVACTSAAGVDITGSADETARCNMVADSKTPLPAATYINPAAFQLAPVGTIGNLGVNALTGPGTHNFDATLQKAIPVHGERYLKLQFQGYNILNHTQFLTYDGTASFSATGVQTNADLGKALTARPARILSAAIRFEF